jgi:hypothetical protein
MEEKILRHLEVYGSITSWEAIMEYGCTRLSQYIYLLRKKGYVIDDVVCKSVNRFGESNHFKKYYLKGVTNE